MQQHAVVQYTALHRRLITSWQCIIHFNMMFLSHCSNCSAQAGCRIAPGGGWWRNLRRPTGTQSSCTSLPSSAPACARWQTHRLCSSRSQLRSLHLKGRPIVRNQAHLDRCRQHQDGQHQQTVHHHHQKHHHHHQQQQQQQQHLWRRLVNWVLISSTLLIGRALWSKSWPLTVQHMA